MIKYLLLLLPLISLSACENPKSPNSGTDVQTATLNITSYGSKSTLQNWPSANNNNSAIADDLLATNYLILVDGSGSMQDDTCANGSTKMRVAREAITAFSSQIDANANIGLYAFDNNGSNLRVPLGIKNRSEFTKQINQINAAGHTPLQSAITDAYNTLTKQAKHQLGYGEYHLVIVTDGEASESENPKPIVSKILSESPVVIHTIGFCIGGGHSLNQPGYINYKQANDMNSLKTGLAEILAEAPDFTSQSFTE